MGGQAVRYMINVDLEDTNIRNGGADNCPSILHQNLGDHYDLTVHVLGCGRRYSREVDRPPTRYWDDNGGAGYTLQGVIGKIHELLAQHPDAHARRCRSCAVDAHLPDWD